MPYDWPKQVRSVRLGSAGQRNLPIVAVDGVGFPDPIGGSLGRSALHDRELHRDLRAAIAQILTDQLLQAHEAPALPVPVAGIDQPLGLLRGINHAGDSRGEIAEPVRLLAAFAASLRA